MVCHTLSRLFPEVGDDERIVAILHDTLEDTPVTYDFLREAGFDDGVLSMLSILTRDKKVAYSDYISGIIKTGNGGAIRVKCADAMVNWQNCWSNDAKKSLRNRYGRSYTDLIFSANQLDRKALLERLDTRPE
jgi:(p)ppGpp synthase/HD superfamily hydrolase